MDLKEKLKYYEPFSKPVDAQKPHTPISDIGHWIQGSEMENHYGRYFWVRMSFPSDYHHGVHSIQMIPDLPGSVYSRIGKDDGLQAFHPMKALYVDTETTGLAGGTGTLPFMIGAGYYTDEGFTVEQFFMRDYPEERAVLSAFIERLGEFESLVTYNGKSYDINILESRTILNRMDHSINRLPHLDLLYTMRRLYKRRLSDCSLGNIEKYILGFERQDDVPGYLIPGIYFEYLRTRQCHRLVSIFDHNRWDILTLAALTRHTGIVYHDPFTVLEHGQDWLSLGRIFESFNLMRQAAVYYKTALQLSNDSEMEQEIRFRLGLIYKRFGYWNEAIQQWEQQTQSRLFQVHPFEELAKYYEHHKRDYKHAIDWVDHAIKRVDMLSQLNPEIQFTQDREALMYRLKRLKRKMSKLPKQM